MIMFHENLQFNKVFPVISALLIEILYYIGVRIIGDRMILLFTDFADGNPFISPIIIIYSVYIGILLVIYTVFIKNMRRIITNPYINTYIYLIIFNVLSGIISEIYYTNASINNSFEKVITDTIQSTEAIIIIIVINGVYLYWSNKQRKKESSNQ